VAVAHPRRLTEQERRNLTVRQGELSALAQHPSWPILEVEIERRREAFERELVAKIFAGSSVDLERQAFLRGFVKGMRYVLAVPGGAEARLDEYLRRQEVA
jgi:hypothetical protein